jgi:hypothetical protein
MITFLSKILNQIAFFGGFLLPSTPEWESSTPLDETSSLTKIVDSLPKTLLEILLFETLPSIASSEPFQGYWLVWHNCVNLEQE